MAAFFWDFYETAVTSKTITLAISGNNVILLSRKKGAITMPARKYKIDPDQLLAGGREILEQSAKRYSVSGAGKPTLTIR